MVNLGEGRDAATIAAIAETAGEVLLDLHRDVEHDRSVLTLAGTSADCERAARSVAAEARRFLRLTDSDGVHPRLGMIDVVPFVPLVPHGTAADLARADLSAATAARDRFAGWASAILALPCFLYGPLGEGERTLPELRRRAFVDLAPDLGPELPDDRLGAVCVGARRVLVAYNLLLDTHDLDVGRRLAAALRSSEVRALAFRLHAGVQVSCNLVAPWQTGPAEVADRLAGLAEPDGVGIRSCELVGLVPEAVLSAVPKRRWKELGLSAASTIEARRFEPLGERLRKPLPSPPAC